MLFFIIEFFWASLCSLEVALDLNAQGFKNLEIVASELVKFLLTNTSYDSIDLLVKKVGALEKLTGDMSKNVKSANSSAIRASNKEDSVQKLLTSLEKRIKKLEEKS